MVKRPKSKEARTRGANLDEPLNRFGVPKERRTITDLLGEHRLEMLAEARELGLQACTDFEAAQWFNVTLSTLNLWKVRDPAFAAALRLGKDIADGRVEATLYQKATGYSYHSEEIKVIDNVVVRVPVVKHVPPSDTAIIFWLKNRQRAKWRDVQDHKVEGKVDVDVSDKAADPRALAMAIIAALREAATTADEEPATIEHDANEAAE